MKNPFRRLEMTIKDIPPLLLNELDAQLRDPTSEIRQLFARVARSEAKNHFALHIGTELEKFERELEARAQRKLANLGSAGLPATPTLEQHVEGALALVGDKALTPGKLNTAVAHIRRADELLKEVKGT